MVSGMSDAQPVRPVSRSVDNDESDRREHRLPQTPPTSPGAVRTIPVMTRPEPQLPVEVTSQPDEAVVPTFSQAATQQTHVPASDGNPSRLLAALRTLGGTAAKSALRNELGMSLDDFVALLQELSSAGLVREDRTRVKVSLVNLSDED